MTSKQLNKIASQIEQTINSRHSTYADMHINCEVFIATSKFAYIHIKPIRQMISTATQSSGPKKS